MQANIARTRQQQRARQGQGRNMPQRGRNLGVDASANAARVPAVGAPNPIVNDQGGPNPDPNPVPAANDAIQQLTAVITNLVQVQTNMTTNILQRFDGLAGTLNQLIQAQQANEPPAAANPAVANQPAAPYNPQFQRQAQNQVPANPQAPANQADPDLLSCLTTCRFTNAQVNAIVSGGIADLRSISTLEGKSSTTVAFLQQVSKANDHLIIDLSNKETWWDWHTGFIPDSSGIYH